MIPAKKVELGKEVASHLGVYFHKNVVTLNHVTEVTKLSIFRMKMSCSAHIANKWSSTILSVFLKSIEQ